MCYEVKCGTCGKSTWGGCGFHVASVQRQIPEGQHCTCHSWPGMAPAGVGSASLGPKRSPSTTIAVYSCVGIFLVWCIWILME
ncbi:hypothetical protein PR202_ga12981 [Eleusine coracana subsp. coracana]|uniref:Uncharacterized protein n=1 Tax=Eleusine coracana subsp. coracana TaxID=191504 RepID=A0AAV5CD22_ELECO|nr:hypothetical protein PR202_ga12981 [Eleusine coracana subsp. coracana]